MILPTTMAAIRAVILYMVFACGDAVWKRNVKSVAWTAQHVLASFACP